MFINARMAKSKVLHDLSPAYLSNHHHKSSISCVPVILKDLSVSSTQCFFLFLCPCKYYSFCLKCFTPILVLLLFFKIQFKLHMLDKAFSGAFYCSPQYYRAICTYLYSSPYYTIFIYLLITFSTSIQHSSWHTAVNRCLN